MALKRWNGTSWEVYVQGAQPPAAHVTNHGAGSTDPVLGRITFSNKTGNYTIALSDEGAYRYIAVNSSSAVTITVPAYSSVPFPTGARVNIIQTGTGKVTVAAATGVTISAPFGLSSSGQGGVINLTQLSANSWGLNGNDQGIPVPNIVGLTTTVADSTITNANLTKGTTTSVNTSNSSLNNIVASQTVAAGTFVNMGSPVGYTYNTYVATPAQPNLSYLGTTGRFTITNYNAAYIYSTTAGTISGSTLTLPSANSSATVVARSFAGGDASPGRYYENKAHSYTPDTRYCTVTGQYCCETGQYCHCGTDAPCDGQSWGQCGCPGPMCWYGSYCTKYCDSVSCGGSAPALINEPGYTNGGSEWYKIV